MLARIKVSDRRGPLRRRFWVEVAAATLSVVTFSLTLLASDWIELIFGVDPDHHSGSLEWLIVGVSVLVTLILSALAYRELMVFEPRGVGISRQADR